MDRMATRVMSLGIGMFGWMSCSALLDVDGKQCRADTDCLDEGLGGQCIENVCVGEALVACTSNSECSSEIPVCTGGSCLSIADTFSCEPEAPSEVPTVRYAFNVRDSLNREVVPERLMAKACQLTDVDCVEPVGVYQDTEGTEEVVLNAPKGLPVYFRVEGEGRLPATLYDSGSALRPNLDRALQNITIPTLEYASNIATLGMLDYDPLTEGILLIQVFDCTGTPASGISFMKNSGKGMPFAFINHIPNTSDTVTQYDPVYNQAYGGFVGVTPGIVGITAYWGDELLGENGATSFNVSVRAATMTYVDLRFYKN